VEPDRALALFDEAVGLARSASADSENLARSLATAGLIRLRLGDAAGALRNISDVLDISGHLESPKWVSNTCARLVTGLLDAESLTEPILGIESATEAPCIRTQDLRVEFIAAHDQQRIIRNRQSSNTRP